MDAASWAAAVAAGTAAGAAAGLLPGLHANTLAALLLAFAPAAGPWGAHAILAAAGAHAFLSILPSTYVGVPGEDTTVSVLPAHRLLREGRGAEAVRVAAAATLAATMGAVLLVLPFKWLVAEPARLLPLLDAGVPWILGGVILLFLAQEWRGRGRRAVAPAALCIAASGALGLWTGGLRLWALVPVPATPLLPLLTGLFGAAGLVHSLLGATPVPGQADTAATPRRARRDAAWACARGVAAAGWTAALPGLTAAAGAAAALAGLRRRDPRAALACMAAVGAAHQVFALALLWVAGRARTGIAIAVQDLVAVRPWDAGRPPDGLLLAAATVLAASAAAHAATVALAGGASRWLARLDGRRASLGALALLATLVLVLSGPLGLLLLALSATVGLLPLAFGVRRVHLTGALLVPCLAARLTA